MKTAKFLRLFEEGEIPFEQLPDETQDDIAHEIFERVPFWAEANREWNWDASDVKGAMEGERLHIVEMPINSITGFSRHNSALAVKKYIGMLGYSEAPPIIVDGNKFIDGGHRFEAYRTAGRKTIPTVDIGQFLRMDWRSLYEPQAR